jgi:hypothetical protein
MSAAEIIAEFEKLNLQEQEEVLNAFAKSLHRAQSEPGEVQYADDAAFRKASGKVLTEHADLFNRWTSLSLRVC